MSTTPVTTHRRPSVRSGGQAAHQNEVTLIGELSRIPQIRLLPDGSEVSTFVLLVRTGARGADAIDCVARVGSVRARLQTRQPGESLQISGALRHRFWRGAGGLMSRYEVEVSSLTAQRRRGRDAGVTDRRSAE